MRYLILILATLAGCGYIIRGQRGYQAEMAARTAIMRSMGATLATFAGDPLTCPCRGDQWPDDRCEHAAYWAVAAATRSEWHYRMSMYLAGLDDERPPDPPDLPAVTPCPLEVTP